MGTGEVSGGEEEVPCLTMVTGRAIFFAADGQAGLSVEGGNAAALHEKPPDGNFPSGGLYLKVSVIF